MKIRTFAHMTPDKRLNQLEPVVADTAQKVDRLIETNSQILDLAIRGNSTAELAFEKADLAARKADYAAEKADTASRNAELAARGVAALTVDLYNFKQEVRQNFQKIDQKIDKIDHKIDTEIGGFRLEMNQRFDQLVTLIQNRL